METSSPAPAANKEKMAVEEILVEPDSGVSIEQDSGISFELHDLQYESVAPNCVPGDDKKGSKVIVVAEMNEQNQEHFCDTSLTRKKSDMKKLSSDNELWKKTSRKSSKKRTKSSQDLVSAEDGDSLTEKNDELFWCEENPVQSEESLVEHFEHLFEAKPYQGVREWL